MAAPGPTCWMVTSLSMRPVHGGGQVVAATIMVRNMLHSGPLHHGTASINQHIIAADRSLLSQPNMCCWPPTQALGACSSSGPACATRCPRNKQIAHGDLCDSSAALSPVHPCAPAWRYPTTGCACAECAPRTWCRAVSGAATIMQAECTCKGAMPTHPSSPPCKLLTRYFVVPHHCPVVWLVHRTAMQRRYNWTAVPR